MFGRFDFLLGLLLGLPLVLGTPTQALAQPDDCAQPAPVCAARAAVFPVTAFDPVGSAVRIGPRRLVTTRHGVADQSSVTVFLPDGTPVEAQAVPSDYPGDLLLLETDGLPEGPTLEIAPGPPAGALHTIGADVGRQAIRAYDPGAVRFLPAEGYPLARLHHGAYSQPGNSGGALVDAEGRLVGIVASGGEGRFEAIPAAEIAALEARSGPAHRDTSAEIGAAVRVCTLLLEDLQRAGPGALDDQQAKALETSCGRSGNRQLYDLAGQTLGRTGRREAAVAMFQRSLAEDPNAVNSRIGLVVTYNLARRYEDSLPHLRWLLDEADDDLQVLRMAIQSGVWGDDRPLAERAFERLKVLNPQGAEAAERFLNNPPPRP